MQLKTFSAKSTAEVLAQIKAELGNEAVILDTREEGGVITMTAALERHMAGQGTHANNTHGTGNTHGDNAFLTGQLGYTESGLQTWQQEWGSIKEHILALVKPALKLDELEPRQKLALEFLQREGVEDETTLALYCALRGQRGHSILAPLDDMVPVEPWSRENWKAAVHFIAGPFGVGKTTTALRLALLLRKNAPTVRLCIINADAARGNGRLFLRHYAELSDVSYKEAACPLELTAALGTAAKEGYDHIFVDLPGLDRTKGLAAFLADAGVAPQAASYFNGSWFDVAAVHLVLAPQYGTSAIKAILERYKNPFRSSIVYTKLDEAENYGQLVNIAHATKLPISALSFGPGLGNSLVPATQAMLWRLVFKRELPKI